MARTIDERIVQMTFNNQEFERRAGTTISTLGKLTNALDLSKITNSLFGIQKVTNSLDFSGITDALTSISKGFNAFEEIAVGVCRRIGYAIGSYILGGLNKVKSVFNSVTVDQFGEGFKKYNDLTSSVQTLVNSTGKSVDEIDGYLKRLMWYSDETSFGFTDMTKALGTMVSSGGDIEKLIPMLMGIGNATAYAGKGASEFTRVIYNLNQSYSSGALNTMDWRSIELAGVDSKVLKEQLLAAAVNLKTINKEQAKLSNFKDLLSKKVFNRDVMEQAFSSFAQMTLEAEKLVSSGVYETASEAIESLSGQYEEFAERAFKSAQEAKSFREAIEATQDAVSSGWMQTFQIIFGDYNESKALWTDLTNTFWDLFASGAARRNNILSAWKDIWDKQVSNPNINSAADYEEWQKVTPYLTQTQALLDAISQTVLTIRDSISDTFRSVFPIHTILDKDGNAIEDYSFTAKVIYNTIEGIRKLFIDIKEVGLKSDFAVALRNNFRGLLEVIKTISAYAKVFNDSFIQPLIERLKPVADQLVAIFNKLGIIIQNTARNVRSNMSPFENLLTNILNIIQPVINLIVKLLDWINKLLEGTNKVSIFDGFLATVGKVVEFISKAVQGSVNVFQKLGGVLSNILPKIKESISTFLSSHGQDVSKIAEGGFLGVLAYGLTTVIKKLKDFKIADIGKNFTSGLADGIKNIFTNLKEGIEGLLGKGGNGKSAELKIMSDAIMKLALALLVLSFVDGEKIGSSLTLLGVALLEAIGALKLISGLKISNASRKALSGVATAILELSIALKIISSISPEQMRSSIIALGFVLLELAAFMGTMALVSKKMKSGNVKSIAKTISKLGFALIEISLALKIMSTLDENGIKSSLIVMGIALAEIGAFIIAISKWTGKGTATKLLTLGPAMVGIGFALIEIAAAMKLLGSMDAASSDRALVGLFGAMATIAAFMVLISKFAGAGSFLAISAGMLILSSAIAVLTVALIALSAVGWNGLKEGLKGLAGLLGIIALSGVALGLLSPLLLLAAASLATFGAALYVVSAAMLKAIIAFAAFQAIGSDFSKTIVKVLTAAFTAIIGLIPAFVFGIIQAILGVLDQILGLITTIFKIVIDFIANNLGNIVAAIINFIKIVLEALIPGVTELMPLLFQLVMAIINGLNDGLIANVETLINNLFNLLIAVINGLANVVRSGGELGTALANLAKALIEGLLSAMVSLIGGLGQGILDIGGGLIEGAQSLWSSLFGGEDQAEQQEDSGAAIVDNVTTGMDSNKDTAYNKADEIGNETAKKMEDAEEATKSGQFTLDGLYNGLTDPDKLDAIYRAGKQAGEMYMLGYNEEMDQHSPSRKMQEEAEFTIAGLVRGFKNLGEVKKSGTDIGRTIYNAISSAISMADQIMDDSLNPVITPVLDLSEIQANKNAIQGLFGSDIAYDGALSISKLRNASEIQNGYKPINSTININFNVDKVGGEITENDISRWGKQIANIVNHELGLQV